MKMRTIRKRNAVEEIMYYNKGSLPRLRVQLKAFLKKWDSDSVLKTKSPRPRRRRELQAETPSCTKAQQPHAACCISGTARRPEWGDNNNTRGDWRGRGGGQPGPIELLRSCSKLWVLSQENREAVPCEDKWQARRISVAEVCCY